MAQPVPEGGDRGSADPPPPGPPRIPSETLRVIKKSKKDGVCHEMLASPRARYVAERLCGIKFMSRRALLRDLTCLKKHDHIEILDDGLREERGSRPTSRDIGGYPPLGLMEYSEIEGELYWKHLYARKPISPEVLQFM